MEIWNLQPNKVLGLDGFSISFHITYWEVIKNDLFKMIQHSQNKLKFGGGTNSTFLALIPKESRLTSFNQLKPISLCNSSQNILTKIFANRLKYFLAYLISKNQGGFIKHKQIIDNTLLVQEAIQSNISREEQSFILKLYIVNSFDMIRHSFFLAVLQQFGFANEFISLIKACTSKPWVVVLVNGKPRQFFQSSKGIGKGCPLLLFFICPHGRCTQQKIRI